MTTHDSDSEDSARLAVTARLAAAARERARRAEELTAALLAWAKPETLPLLPAARPPEDQLEWLRAMTGEALYTWTDAQQAADWLGSDAFRLRELPAAPPFLADLAIESLPAELVGPLLRRINLTRPAPTAAELTIKALSSEPGRVSTWRRSAEQQRWGRPADEAAPLLPPVARVPKVLHSIWLGGIVPQISPVRRNLGYAARRYAGHVDVVLWTDLPRSAFAEDGDPEVRRFAEWARQRGVILANVHEVFHAGAPMITHAQVVLEMTKQLPRGYAAASDMLRVELIHRFGGVYLDGDLQYTEQWQPAGPWAPQGPRAENLVEFMNRLAASDLGFTMNPMSGAAVGGCPNDALAGPAGHPALRLWLEAMRVNYFRPVPRLFETVRVMALPYVGRIYAALRYLTPVRTGRVHHAVLEKLGLNARDLPPTQPPFRFRSAGSWVRAGADAKSDTAPVPGHEEVVRILARCLTYLEWQLAARLGDLHLTSIAPIVRNLPEPDAAWLALLNVFGTLSGPRGVGSATTAVRSVTDVRRRDDGSLQRIELPPEVEALIDRRVRVVSTDTETDTSSDWIGAELSPGGADAVWLLDERVEPALLREVGVPVSSLLDVFAPLTEVALDPTGRPIGLWIRPLDSAEESRDPERFAQLPPDHVGVSIGGPAGWDWGSELPLSGETLAELLLDSGLVGSPVVLSVPEGSAKFAKGLATRLGAYLDQPVEIVGVSRPSEPHEDSADSAASADPQGTA